MRVLSRARDIETIYIIIYYTTFVNRFLKISFDFFEFFFLFQNMLKNEFMLKQKSDILQKIVFVAFEVRD